MDVPGPSHQYATSTGLYTGKEEVEEVEKELDVASIEQIWPSFCREAELPGPLLEWARRKKNWRLRCQDHKGWFFWHPPRPGGCLLCHRKDQKLSLEGATTELGQVYFKDFQDSPD